MNPVRINAKIGRAEFNTAFICPSGGRNDKAQQLFSRCNLFATPWHLANRHDELCNASLSEPGFQLAVQYLARCVARHLVFSEESVRSRALVAGQAILRPLNQVGFLERRAVVQHDDGMDTLTPFFVRKADYRHILYKGM